MNKQEKKNIKELSRNLSWSAATLNRRIMRDSHYYSALAMVKTDYSSLMTMISLLSNSTK